MTWLYIPSACSQESAGWTLDFTLDLPAWESTAYAAACLVARMEDAALDQAPVWDCISTFDGRAWRGKVECVIGGPPCQPYSLAGRQRGHDDERSHGVIWGRYRGEWHCNVSARCLVRHLLEDQDDRHTEQP